jgi:uncharacterized protein (TIGR02391 family)
MNLETRLLPPLWEAVRASVEARNFSSSVLDSIHHLSEVIRERSGLEGDGVALVGAAFGGSAPKLKVNRLQTESDENVQRGVEALLRGVYQAIRNPRSHGAHQDDERSATAIILFVDHLLRIVDQSRAPFSMSAFTAKVFDTAFVPKMEYAQLLTREVPETRKPAVARELFTRRSEGEAINTASFLRVLLTTMKPEEVDDIYELMSEELAVTDEDDTLRFVLTAIEGYDWPRLAEASRMRAEHKLIASMKSGRYSSRNKKCLAGNLGTWATRITAHLRLSGDLWRAVAGLLEGNAEQSDYAFTFFTPHIEGCFVNPPANIVVAVNAGMTRGDQRFADLVDVWASTTEIDTDLNFILKAPEHPWRAPFVAMREKFIAIEPDDDIPF